MPTHHRGSARERRALDAYIELARASAAVDARINRPLGEHGLTVSQFGVLEALWHLGPLSQREIGREILKSSGNVTMVIDNLCRSGLVRREDDPADRRVRRVALTAAGRERVEVILPSHVGRVVAAFACLDAAEQEALASLLERLGRFDAGTSHGSPAAPEPSAPSAAREPATPAATPAATTRGGTS